MRKARVSEPERRQGVQACLGLYTGPNDGIMDLLDQLSMSPLFALVDERRGFGMTPVPGVLPSGRWTFLHDIMR